MSSGLDRAAMKRAERWDVLAGRLPLVALVAFCAVAGLIGLLAVVVHRFEFGDEVNFPFLHGPVWLDALFQGDSGWYYAIADRGYSYTVGQQSSVAFFPAYPLAVLALGWAVLDQDWSTAAGVVTLASGAGAAMLFADWARRRLPARTAVIAVAILLLYPYSFFLYGTGYSDAFFLLTVLGAFALLERERFVLSAVVGAVAVAGRPVGMAVAVGLVVRAVEMAADRRAPGEQGEAQGRRTLTRESAPLGWRRLVAGVRQLGWWTAVPAASGLSLVVWMLYLEQRFGDPLAFLTVQGAPGWEQPGGPATWFKFMFAEAIALGRWGTVALLVPQALACAAALLLLRTTWRRFGWGYTAYAVVSLAIPIIGTKDFMGCGRYVLAAFPVIGAAAVIVCSDRCPPRLVRAALLVLMAGLMIGTVLYVAGVEVS